MDKENVTHLSEQLSHSYRMMQYIIEHDHNAIAVLNRDLKYVYVSKRFLTDYNIREADILGKNHYDVFPGLHTFMELTQLKDLDFIIKQEIVEENSVIMSDKGKFEKIFFHLIDNAVKFTQRGSIVINLSQHGNYLQFNISDTGIGIPEEKQSVIFDPFRQLETGLNRSYGGTGLGLTIVKAYVDILKGDISLSSGINKGTSITISIPVTPGVRRATEDKNAMNHDDIETILIAEDEYSNFKYLYEVLHSDNVEILHAHNGREAVDICRKSKDIKMILMDLKMPVMDGTSAAKQIREFRPQLPIIAQTAYVPEAEKVNTVFDDHIAKPINRHDLMLKMSKYIHVGV